MTLEELELIQMECDWTPSRTAIVHGVQTHTRNFFHCHGAAFPRRIQVFSRIAFNTSIFVNWIVRVLDPWNISVQKSQYNMPFQSMRYSLPIMALQVIGWFTITLGGPHHVVEMSTGPHLRLEPYLHTPGIFRFRLCTPKIQWNSKRFHKIPIHLAKFAISIPPRKHLVPVFL